MPCYDGRDRPSCRSDDAFVLRSQLERAHSRLDEVTRHLCYLCGEVRFTGGEAALIDVNPELAQWWHRHQEMDELRVRTEMEDSRLATPALMAAWFTQQAAIVHRVSRFHYAWFLRLAEEEFARRERIAGFSTA